jgi:hypothetical protein
MTQNVIIERFLAVGRRRSRRITKLYASGASAVLLV